MQDATVSMHPLIRNDPNKIFEKIATALSVFSSIYRLIRISSLGEKFESVILFTSSNDMKSCLVSPIAGFFKARVKIFLSRSILSPL